MSRPEVSVVMPVRNGERTVAAAVESLLHQDFENFEIIIVDHLSTDRTPKILSGYAATSSRIRTFRCEGSFIEAANLCWQRARAPLVARMDADDVAHPDRLKRQKKYLDNHPDHVACATLVRIRKRGQDGGLAPPDGGYQRYESWVNSVVSPETISAQRFVDSPLPNPSTMIRKAALEEIGGFQDTDWAEDYDLWLRMLERNWLLGKVPLGLLDWIDAPERSTRTLERYSLHQFQRAKAHYLARMTSVREQGVVISGAGPIGKEFARLLTDETDATVHAFLEVNPRQVGNRIRGIPVLPAEEISSFRGRVVMLGAAGQPGARDRIRSLAEKAGFIEGSDFFSVT